MGDAPPASVATPYGTCAAPFTSMRFEPDGRVSVCCVNGQYALGHADRQSIREIWEGTRVAELRAAISRGDFSRGCEDCREPHRQGRRDDTEARTFDVLVGPDLGRWPRRLEFALSNTCNLQCVHCNGELSSAIRARRERRAPLPRVYGDRFFDELEEFLPHLQQAAFLGGEPFLSSEARRVWDLLIEGGHRPEVHVTTNATVLDERVERYVTTLGMHVAVSIDAVSAEVFEAIRVGADHARTMQNVSRLAELCRSVGSTLAINHCLMSSNWHEFDTLLSWADAEELDVSLILVTYPRSMSLLHLDRSELASVVRHLEEQAATVRLDRNQHVREVALRRLRAALDGAVSTAVADPTVRPASAESRFRHRLAVELDANPQRPVLLQTRDDIIVSVDDQPWAAQLGLGSMIGTSVLRLLPTLASRLGVELALETEEPEPSVTLARVAARDGAHGVALRSIAGEWTDSGARHGVVALWNEAFSPG